MYFKFYSNLYTNLCARPVTSFLLLMCTTLYLCDNLFILYIWPILFLRQLMYMTDSIFVIIYVHRKLCFFANFIFSQLIIFLFDNYLSYICGNSYTICLATHVIIDSVFMAIFIYFYDNFYFYDNLYTNLWVRYLLFYYLCV